MNKNTIFYKIRSAIGYIVAAPLVLGILTFAMGIVTGAILCKTIDKLLCIDNFADTKINLQEFKNSIEEIENEITEIKAKSK